MLEAGYHKLPAGYVASVVAYLDLTCRPETLAPRLRLAKVEQPEPGWYRELFRKIGADWLWFSRLRMAEADLREKLGRAETEVYAFGNEQGFVELERQGPEVEIALFGLAPGETGRGLGYEMMDETLREAWRPETQRVWLHTCTLDSPRALPFYLRCGFRAYARGVEVAPDPRLLGYVSETAAPQVPIIR